MTPLSAISPLCTLIGRWPRLSVLGGGEGIDCQRADYYRQEGKDFIACVGDTTRVESYESGQSPYGAYDMTGNVWEWVMDW